MSTFDLMHKFYFEYEFRLVRTVTENVKSESCRETVARLFLRKCEDVVKNTVVVLIAKFHALPMVVKNHLIPI